MGKIITQLQQQKDFTGTEKRIADYLLLHLREVTQLTIQELAKKTYASHSALIRLSQKLGFSGFRKMRLDLVAEVSEGEILPENIDPNFPFHPYDSPEKITQQIADLMMEAIQQTQRQLDHQALQKIATALTTAQRTFLFANGDSQIRARSFQNKFNKINRYLIIADEYGENEWSAVNLQPTDLAIFISIAVFQKIIVNIWHF